MNLLSTLLLFGGSLPSTLAIPGISKLMARQREVTEDSKAGLAWPNGDSVDMSQYESTGKVSWYYTWSAWPVEGTDLEFVPILWGERSVSDFEKNLDGILKEGFESGSIRAVLGFNEPNDGGQANFSPEDAKELWVEHLEPLREQYDVRLGSPATSSAPSGKTWTQDFIDECGSDCNIDFIALHWYGNNATHFIDYINDFHETFDKPIWVTEWACHDFTGEDDQCSEEETVAFLNATQSYMDSVDWVERYSWFGAMPNPPVNEDNALMDDEGRINDLGAQYIGSNETIITTDPSPSLTTFISTSTTAITSNMTTSISTIFSTVTSTSYDRTTTFTSTSPAAREESPESGWLGIGSVGCPVLPPPVAFHILGRATFSLGILVFVSIYTMY